MNANTLIQSVFPVLGERHADVRLDGRFLYVGRHVVVRVLGDGVTLLVPAAQVFNGHHHYVPDGHCDMRVTAGSRFATVDRIVAAIEKRMAARAKSLPVPVDASAIVRDP